tara:strand:+ start:1165 stop:1932 length:768 start_codon:yes stop_codon:yes gene_type:complete
MKALITIINIILLFSINSYAREVGETEITTEDGIEVFQNEKFYLLKKNVKIKSDNFTLNANNVKIDFDDSLYDIIELNAEGNVDFYSQESEIRGNGKFLKFEIKIENLKIEGQGSKLIAKDVKMFSDGYIEVNNISGNFSLKGLNSKLVNDNIVIKAKSIDGVFFDLNDKKEITNLSVFDEEISYVKNKNTEMYANKINFNNQSSIIELIDNVIIIRDGERITGDYGTLDTSNNSYKIKSNDQGKVKVIIQSNEQ